MRKPKAEHFTAITSPEEVGALLRTMDAFKCTLVVQSEPRLAPLAFTRPGELRGAQWAEIDFEREVVTVGSQGSMRMACLCGELGV